MKTNQERLSKLLSGLESISYIKPEDIPNIQLYMDQVTTFMDEHLKHTKRYQIGRASCRERVGMFV